MYPVDGKGGKFMKVHSIQFKFLITVISAMLAIAVFVGGVSIYEVDHFVRLQTEDLITATGKKEAAQINSVFGDMEKSVKIMESYALDLIDSKADIEDRDAQKEIIDDTAGMFADVAKHTDGAIAYYIRFSPEISDYTTGFFYNKVEGSEEYIAFELTDLSLYEEGDTEHVGWFWQPYAAGEAIWMQPYHNQNNGILMISYVVPLYRDGRFIGVVGMDFDYTVLTDRVHEIKIYEHGFAHLELDGAVIHNVHETDADDYLRVSEQLRNGMTLVLSASYKDIRQIRHHIAAEILFVVLALVALTSVVVILAVKKIVSPLRALTAASEKLATGNYDVEIDHGNTYEIKLLSTAFENMAMYLREHEELQHNLAYRDSMTGLRNTTSYKGWVMDFDKEIQNGNMDFGVIVLDVNGLKETNDRHGHDVGNELIVAAARIIAGVFKRSPVFRIGGDEFVVILQNEDLKDCEELMVKFASECADTVVKADETSIAVSIAKGFAKYDAARDLKFADVFGRADAAMYDNKRSMKAT